MGTTPPKSYAIGIMSGTSVDGIDAVVLEIGSNNHFRIISTNSVSFPASVQNSIRRLCHSSHNEIEILGEIHSQLAQLYFEAIKPLIEPHDVFNISVVGCHGQTIRHRPNSPFPFTLQLGNGAALANLANLPVVSDFRSADLAAGGQGAPLAPAFHHAAFSSPTKNRVVVNIGGISNITYLPRDPMGTVIGFDTGPGNTLLDSWIRKHHGLDFDRDAKWASSGTAIPEFLDMLLNEPYFAQSWPKSTGLEYFNLTWLEDILAKFTSEYTCSARPEDVQATLVSLTAQTIAHQIMKLRPSVDEVYVCGGGANNPMLMQALARILQIPTHSTESVGIAPQWVEAAAFAWMAHRTTKRQTSTLPSVTGARKPTVAGAIYYP